MSFPDAARLLGADLLFPCPSRSIEGGSIDTRTLQPGDLFVALRGERDDGHRHLEEAFRKRASGALIDRGFFAAGRDRSFKNPGEVFQNLLPVADPEKALARLADRVRSSVSLAAVGITGSVGKTTTKEFLHFILRQKYPVLANPGNFNNYLGLPLTLLRLDKNHRFCIAELGANHSGEIRALAGLLKPAAAIITAIAPAHLEGFGTLEKIMDAKLELAEALPSNAPLVIPDDDPGLFQKARRFGLKIIRVGQSREADCRISAVRVRGSRVSFVLNQKREYAFPGIAGFLARNAAMAVAMAEALGVGPEEIPEVWEGLTFPAGRFQECRIGEIRVIHDGYNANPASFEKALEAFSALEIAGRKILVFADMLELGSEEKKCHEELGRKIARSHLDYTLAYGPRAAVSVEVLRKEMPGFAAEHFSSPDEITVFLNHWLRPGDAVLLKASRGMKIERILDALRERETDAFCRPRNL